ncbi:uncharacterized protein Gasu_56250 [Galdieria sulphuraria]|uniref:Uncharacterized protein n=1 Tax=Galdieria sulphuraria TaxID=130081 RepID=M2VU56_GALSU|nr:uncharacterized protein Gasu_56250 [Galdieria sulphuraria]EME26726.1 hypothetical protein Gasu_56250 [Galdieria sulphuraria]|eukprot:XP_005703246.1 hypothetical protein Gasu_56250 [Galdieria sulphuraria]
MLILIKCWEEPSSLVANSELTGYETPPQNMNTVVEEDSKLFPTSPMTWDSNELQQALNGQPLEEQRSANETSQLAVETTTADSLPCTISVEASSPPLLSSSSSSSPLFIEGKMNRQHLGCLPFKDFVKTSKETDAADGGNTCSYTKLFERGNVMDSKDANRWNPKDTLYKEDSSDSIETRHSSTDGISKAPIYITEKCTTASSIDKPTLKQAKLTDCCGIM